MKRRVFGMVAVVLAGAATVSQGRGNGVRRVERVYRITDDTADAVRVLGAVRKRVEPYGVTAEGRGAREIVLSIPYPEEVEQADAAVQAAVDAFNKVTPKQGEVEKALALADGGRDAAMDRAFKDIPGLKTGLSVLESASDDRRVEWKKYDQAPEGPARMAVWGPTEEAEGRYQGARHAFFSRILSTEGLVEALDLARDSKDSEAKTRLEALPENYQLQAAWIKPVLEAQAKLEAAGGGKYRKPASFDLLLRATDRLDFRVGIKRDQLGGADGKEYRAALDAFAAQGPEAKVKVGGIDARWFAIAGAEREAFNDPTLVQAAHGEKLYILCYDDSDHTLLHEDPAKKPWLVTVGQISRNAGEPSLAFRLDAVGAHYMRKLSAANTHQELAMLLSDEVLSAPTLYGVISEEGEVTFGYPTKEKPAVKPQREAEALRAALSGLPVEWEHERASSR